MSNGPSAKPGSAEASVASASDARPSGCEEPERNRDRQGERGRGKSQVGGGRITLAEQFRDRTSGDDRTSEVAVQEPPGIVQQAFSRGLVEPERGAQRVAVGRRRALAEDRVDRVPGDRRKQP